MNKKKLAWAGGIAVVVVAAVVMLCVWLRPSSSNLLRHLPAESSMVGRIDLPALAQQESPLGNLLSGFVSSDEVSQSGVDFGQSAYVFAVQNYFGCVVPLNDEQLFLKALNLEEGDVETSRGMKWGEAFARFLLCSDGDKAIIVGPVSFGDQDNLRNAVSQWMQQSDVQISKSLQQTLEESSGEATLVCSPQNLPSAVGSLLQEADINLDKCLLVASLSTSEEQLSLSLALTGDTKSLENGPLAACQPLDGTLAGAVTDHPLLFVEAGLNGKKLMEMLRRDPEMRTKLLGLNMVFDLDLIANSIDGDVSLTVPEATNQLLPDVLLQASISSDVFMQHVGEWNGGATESAGVQFLPYRDNLYKVIHEDVVAYFGTESHRLFISSQPALASAQPKGAKALPDGVRGSLFYACVDLQKACRQWSVLQLLPASLRNDYARIELVLSDATHVSLTLSR